MTWPTSLESNVSNTIVQQANAFAAGSEVYGDEDGAPDIYQLDVSSGGDTGNTTSPPTMFGIIPLGNSFSIPITFDPDSKIGKHLPASALSDSPTTWTKQGVTHLNWTVDLARGTRFVLVAGVGSDMQWASGGSSKMMTVGQGNTACVGFSQAGDAAPSVTASG
jgi:hypothetical protein